MKWLLLLASITVVLLSVIAVYYSLSWKRRKREIKQYFENEEKVVNEKRESAKQGICLIARAYLQDQVSADYLAF